MALDVIIKNADVIDGTGKKRVKSDVGIQGDSVTALAACVHN